MVPDRIPPPPAPRTDQMGRIWIGSHCYRYRDGEIFRVRDPGGITSPLRPRPASAACLIAVLLIFAVMALAIMTLAVVFAPGPCPATRLPTPEQLLIETLQDAV